MRDIRFRAWDPVVKKMWHHDHGDWTRFGDYFEWYPIAIPIGENDDSYNGLGNLPKISDFILMQYTGLMDKNGIEIYPQDIIAWHGWGWEGGKPLPPIIGEVVFCAGVVGGCEGPNIFEYRFREGSGLELHNLWNLSQMEVIGNIYEQPELLEKS